MNNNTQYKDDKDRVIVKSDGSYTYLTPDLNKHHLIFNVDSTHKNSFDGTLYGGGINQEWTGTYTIPLFCGLDGGTDYVRYSKIKLYSCKIYNSYNILVRNFIPCYRKSDNVIGLYDTYTQTFYVNNGTGTFIKGNNTPKKQKFAFVTQI